MYFLLTGLIVLNIAAFGFAWSRHKIFAKIREIDSTAISDMRDWARLVRIALDADRNEISSSLADVHHKLDALNVRHAAPTPDTAIILTNAPVSDEWVQIAAQKTGHSIDELERIGDIVRSKVGHALIATVTVNVH